MPNPNPRARPQKRGQRNLVKPAELAKAKKLVGRKGKTAVEIARIMGIEVDRARRILRLARLKRKLAEQRPGRSGRKEFVYSA